MVNSHRLLEPLKEYHREWSLHFNRKRFKIRGYGFCHWSKVIFLWEDGEEFYRLTRNMKIWAEKGDENIFRSEYFKGRLIRRYKGLHNCFVEFCEFLWKYPDYPDQEIFSNVVKTLKLDKITADKYIKFFQECFKRPTI